MVTRPSASDTFFRTRSLVTNASALLSGEKKQMLTAPSVPRSGVASSSSKPASVPTPNPAGVASESQPFSVRRYGDAGGCCHAGLDTRGHVELNRVTAALGAVARCGRSWVTANAIASSAATVQGTMVGPTERLDCGAAQCGAGAGGFVHGVFDLDARVAGVVETPCRVALQASAEQCSDGAGCLRGEP